MQITPEPWHWLILGIIFILLEIVTPSFAVLWFGLASLVVGGIVWLIPDLAFSVQLFIWSIFSASFAFAWFKWIKPLAVDKTKAGLSRESTIGQVGMVIQTLPNHVMVRFSIPVLGADEWQCRSTYELNVGDRVQVIDILGNDLLVKPYNSQSTQEPSA